MDYFSSGPTGIAHSKSKIWEDPPPYEKKLFPLGNCIAEKLSNLQSKWCDNIEEKTYQQPVKYCEVEGVDARKITGVRQSQGEREPNVHDILHQRELSVMYGTPLMPDYPGNPAFDRPYIHIPKYVDPKKMQKLLQKKKMEEEDEEYDEDGEYDEDEEYDDEEEGEEEEVGASRPEEKGRAEASATSEGEKRGVILVYVPEYEDAGVFEDL